MSVATAAGDSAGLGDLNGDCAPLGVSVSLEPARSKAGGVDPVPPSGLVLGMSAAQFGVI